MSELGERLESWRSGRACLLGLGNPDQGDDGLGLRLSQVLAARLGGGASGEGDPLVIEAGLAPERHLGKILEQGFEHVVFLDAVDFGGAPGEVMLADAAEMEACLPPISTHRISLGLLAKCIEDRGARAWLVGVQPKSLAPGPGLSAPVRRRSTSSPRSSSACGGRGRNLWNGRARPPDGTPDRARG